MGPYRTCDDMSLDELRHQIRRLEKDNQHLKDRIKRKMKTKILVISTVAVALFSMVGLVWIAHVHKRATERAASEKAEKIHKHNYQLAEDTFDAARSWIAEHNRGVGDPLCEVSTFNN